MIVGYGVTANIAASHAAARGSTPRIRVFFASVSPFEQTGCSRLRFSDTDRRPCRSTAMTKVLICGDLAWADAEAKEMFAGLAEVIVSIYR